MKRKRLKLSPDQVVVRSDLTPADPVVTKLFHCLQLAWRNINGLEQERVEELERYNWDRLMEHLTSPVEAGPLNRHRLAGRRDKS